MALTHERVFRVRHYECDAYDSVYYTNYLRYIQETAMDASAAAGFGADWYASRGFSWLVRDTSIDFLHPLRYGDSVRVRTRVRNMRQALSKRAYELFRVSDDALVARAETDWAFIDAATGRPARIAPEIRERFFSDGDPPDEPRDRFPTPPPPPPGAHVQRRRVEWRDIDPAQHVNNSVYLAYSEDCAVEAMSARGWPPARCRSEGFSLAFTRCRIEYRTPAVLSDELTVTTWLSDVSQETAVRHFAIRRAGDEALLARACVELACVDARTGARIAFPHAALESVHDTIAAEDAS